MTKTKRLRSLVPLVAASVFAAIFAAAATASTPTLEVGEPAPALDNVMTWIKGQPVTRFKAGHVYVVEFWATWCPSCNAAMPRLSVLQKKYAGRLTVIGVNARETEESDGSLEYVKAFVAKQGEKMAYTVAMDDPEKKRAFDAWMTAGGIAGIPATFVVDKAGTLVWVGHPFGKSEPAFNAAVEQALQGASDLAAARDAQQEVNERTAARSRDKQLLGPMREALLKKDYPGVVVEADRLVALEPQYASRVFTAKFVALLHLSEDQALALANDKAKDRAFLQAMSAGDAGQYWDVVGAAIAKEAELSQMAYRLAVGYLRKSLGSHPERASRWASLATAHFRLGDIDAAIAAQEQAIVRASGQGLPEEYLERLKQSLANYRGARSNPQARSL